MEEVTPDEVALKDVQERAPKGTFPMIQQTLEAIRTNEKYGEGFDVAVRVTYIFLRVVEKRVDELAKEGPKKPGKPIRPVNPGEIFKKFSLLNAEVEKHYGEGWRQYPLVTALFDNLIQKVAFALLNPVEVKTLLDEILENREIQDRWLKELGEDRVYQVIDEEMQQAEKQAAPDELLRYCLEDIDPKLPITYWVLAPEYYEGEEAEQAVRAITRVYLASGKISYKQSATYELADKGRSVTLKPVSHWVSGRALPFGKYAGWPVE
jgi:hypothetical protein